MLFHQALPCTTIMLPPSPSGGSGSLGDGLLKSSIVVLAVGMIATALTVGAVRAADPPVAVAAPATTNAGATAPTAAANPEPSRYQFYNGYWWYWMPDNHWLCYMNGQWVSPGTPVQTSAPVPVPAPVYPVPQPYYGSYPYGYDYPYPYYGGGISFGFGGYGGYGHGGYGHGGYGHGGHH